MNYGCIKDPFSRIMAAQVLTVVTFPLRLRRDAVMLKVVCLTFYRLRYEPRVSETFSLVIPLSSVRSSFSICGCTVFVLHLHSNRSARPRCHAVSDEAIRWKWVWNGRLLQTERRAENAGGLQANCLFQYLNKGGRSREAERGASHTAGTPAPRPSLFSLRVSVNPIQLIFIDTVFS